MRITEIHIERWRNLENVHLEIPSESSLVSLVGSNGSGKTNVLELLSFAAPYLGLAAGVRPLQRQSPPPDAQFRVALQVSEIVDIPADITTSRFGRSANELVQQWDGTLTFWRLPFVPPTPPPGYPAGHVGEAVLAGGVPDQYCYSMGQAIVQAIHQRLELNHLFLDAERSYARLSIGDEEILAAAREDPTEPVRRRQQAIAATSGMYTEWVRAMLGFGHRYAAEFTQTHAEAAERGEPGPEYQDPWEEYRAAVSEVMPHLAFSRPDQHDQRTLLFRAGGQEVPYHELSGGEREVAFLIGQLVRFQLHRGILLLDEPELHLNAELLERWLSYAAQTVTEGQVWIATHSLEAVEVAGPENAFVLERDPDGIVRSATALSERPLMSTLAGALGAPAFSLDRQRFVLVEGERPSRERNRFADLCPSGDTLFLEAGHCRQIVGKLGTVLEFARETDRIRVGGIVDRDHWNARQRQVLLRRAPVHFLEVHEVENFFLLPSALAVLVERNGDPPEKAKDYLREASDRFAGIWVTERAAVRHDIDLGARLRSRASELTWQDIDGDRAGTAKELADLAELGDDSIRPRVSLWLDDAIQQYADLRDTDDLWKECSGKQVSRVLADKLGASSREVVERQVLQLLSDDAIEAPQELLALRSYVEGLSPIR